MSVKVYPIIQRNQHVPGFEQRYYDRRQFYVPSNDQSPQECAWALKRWLIWQRWGKPPYSFEECSRGLFVQEISGSFGYGGIGSVAGITGTPVHGALINFDDYGTWYLGAFRTPKPVTWPEHDVLSKCLRVARHGWAQVQP